ncbi:MAG: hypothetical protein AAF846_04385 [Chloroflexota bacterium]
MLALSSRPIRNIIAVLVLLLLSTTILPSTFAQQDNICRSNDLPTINLNETLTGTVEPNLPTLLCFEAERGSTITVTVQPLSQGLISALDVGTPFIDNTGALVDLPIISERANSAGSSIQGTATIEADGTYLIVVVPLNESRGSFSITLELSGGNVLGTNTDTETSDNNDEPATTDGTANIVYGETDLCTTSFSTAVAYGDTIEDTVSDIQPLLYCFEATEGDIVTIDLTIGELPVAYLLVDPFYDLAETTPRFADALAQVPDETVSREITIPQDGRYVIFVLGLIPESSGDFTLTIDGFAGNIYTCQNDPIETLVNNVWAITDNEGNSLIELVFACSQRLSFSALGGSQIVPFNVTQDDAVFFLYQGRSFTSVSLADGEWLVERDDGETFTFETVADTTVCEDDNVSSLVQGSWFWELDQTQRFFLDFTCDGTVFIDNTQSEPNIGIYEFEDDTLTVDFGGQVVEFRDVVISDEVLATNIVIGDIEPVPFELPNVLYDAPTAEEE